MYLPAEFEPLTKRDRALLTTPANAILKTGMVGAEGLEPSRPKGQRILSPLCLPIPPRPHIT